MDDELRSEIMRRADVDQKARNRIVDLMRQGRTTSVPMEEARELQAVDADRTDRVLIAEGKPQRYGTQFTTADGRLEPQPLEDPEHVDELRATVGLSSLEEYARLIREMHSPSE